MEMYAIQLISAVLLVFVLFIRVESYCWQNPAIPDENGNFPSTCTYKGIVFESGSAFKLPEPDCEQCTCLMGSLSCCGYGRAGGVYQIQGCTPVFDDNSCNVRFVNSTNGDLPCNFGN